MRTIKFRGRFIGEDGYESYVGDKKKGDVIYGGYMRGDLTFEDGAGDYIIVGDGNAYRVEPESVEQCLGVDENGKEIYEGDTVINEYNNTEYKIEYRAFAFSESGWFLNTRQIAQATKKGERHEKMCELRGTDKTFGQAI